MLWWAVSPFLIACLLSPLLAIATLILARKRGMRWLYSVVLSVVLSVISFIPLCIVAYVIMSPFRFGEFHADNFDSVAFPRVQVYLPQSASDITMVTNSHNHHTRFTISENDLNKSIESLWGTHGKRSPMTRGESAFADPVVYDGDNPTLRHLGLSSGQSCLHYEGPYQGDWGGPTLWYDPVSQTAWQRVGYW